MLNEEALFRAKVPAALQRAIVRAVFDGCAVASELAEARDPNFRVDLLPHLRRTAVESALSQLRLPKGFTSSIVDTPSTHYTKISSPDVVLTAVTRARIVKYVPPYR